MRIIMYTKTGNVGGDFVSEKDTELWEEEDIDRTIHALQLVKTWRKKHKKKDQK